MSVQRRLSMLMGSLVLGFGIMLMVGFFYLQSSRQHRSGTIEIKGLRGPVSVAFDEWAIPTIVATNELDVARSQGFIHASDRLWQLELFHRIARGRLAELFGPPAVSTDRLVRTLDLWGTAERELQTIGPHERAVLEAFSEGVNARIESWRGSWPPEFLILGIEPQIWSPQVSVAIGRIMSLDLSGWRTELSRMSAVARLGDEYHEALLPNYPNWGPTITQDEAASAFRLEGIEEDKPTNRSVQDAVSSFASALRVTKFLGYGAENDTQSGWDPLSFLSGFGFHSSNSWALGRSRTEDGHPLLANDPHLALRAPSTWYLNTLCVDGAEYAVAGFSIPGTPGVIIGMNRHIAWAFTNAMVDDADFVVEAVNLDQSMYRTGEDWRAFDVRSEQIAVRGADQPVTFTIRSTVRGPVITDAVPTGGLTLSLLWTGREPLGVVAALLAMNRASNEEQFLAGVERFRSPHQNVLYATTSGAIGYRMSGSVPVRVPGEGALPVSFERFPDGWTDFWPFDSMPAIRQPSSDYLATANNLQSRRVFGRVGRDYPAPFRARRIDDVVSQAEHWAVEDMRKLQVDSYSLWAERLRPRAVESARRAGEDALVIALESWDLRAEIDALGAAPFYVWLYRLRALIAADEFVSGDAWFPDLGLIHVLENPQSPWVDDVRTPEIERIETLEEEAARTAAGVVGQPWGAVHKERSAHLLGEVRILNQLLRLNIGPYPARGGRHTIRPDSPNIRLATDSTFWPLPNIGEFGPSARFVAHLDPDEPVGYFLLPTGQSGNPLDKHYRDMSRVWSDNQLIQLSPLGSIENPRSELKFVPSNSEIFDDVLRER
jgi:penicillin amidase